jgi:non-homologous end joining protein Ku
VVETPAEHAAPVIDIMEALKRSLAEKRKPVKLATASAAAAQEEMPMEAAPKKRARKSGTG